MIQGVRLKRLKVIPDSRGRLMEILRCDEECFERFGQVYLTTLYPGVIKGWHYHKVQTDNFACIAGMIKVVLYDNREDSPTYSQIDEVFIGIHNPCLVSVPPNILHGFKNITEAESLVINIPTLAYNYAHPDEFRLAPDTGTIPYDWYKIDG